MWEKKIWFESVLILFAITWFDLQFEQIADWMDMNSSKFI